MYHPRLKGKHYDMGQHYGELLAKSGVDLSPVIIIPEQQTAFGLSCILYEQMQWKAGMNGENRIVVL